MAEAKMVFKVDSFRKIPNPYKDEANSIPQMYTAICDVKDIPEELLQWMDTNPRKQNTKSGVAKKIKESLLTGCDFHLLNRGLLLSAAEVSFNNYDGMMTVIFSDSNVHGDVDGGHTLRIILENRDELEAGQQYVKLEILTGVESIFEDLAAARNTSTQVKDQSIADLRNYFELIKDVIRNEEFNDRVYFVENDEGDIDVGDILAVLNLFNIDTYKGRDNYPIVSFSSRKKCIDTYIANYQEHEDNASNPYVKMRPLMISFFKLYDMLERKMSEYYKLKNPGGKYGLTKGVTTASDGKIFKSKYYQNDMQHLSPNGFIFPILGAFRALLEEKDGTYHWLKDPFVMMDKVGPELVATTVERSRTLGGNPNAVGKDKGNWDTLYMIVKFEAMDLR